MHPEYELAIDNRLSTYEEALKTVVSDEKLWGYDTKGMCAARAKGISSYYLWGSN